MVHGHPVLSPDVCIPGAYQGSEEVAAVGWALKRIRSGKPRYTGAYRDDGGRLRSAGTFDFAREAIDAARRQEMKASDGTWIDPAAGRITFAEYALEVWLPSRHLEVSTRAGYLSNLRTHFVPYFGPMPLAKIKPSTVQGWVSHAVELGLSPRSIAKYHTMLHSVFARAVRDHVILTNPCDGIELPKIPPRKARILTPAEYDRLLAAIPVRFQLLVMTDSETGLRWGELIALRPRHMDFLRRTISVEQTIVEVSRKHSPTGERMSVKDYPKDNEFRTLRVSETLLARIAGRIERLGLGRDDLIFPSTESAGGRPMSHNTFRTKVWLPALKRSGIDFHVRVHDPVSYTHLRAHETDSYLVCRL